MVLPPMYNDSLSGCLPPIHMSDQKSLTKQQLLMYEIAVYRLLDGSTAQQELQIPQKMRHYTTVHTTTFMRRCAV